MLSRKEYYFFSISIVIFFLGFYFVYKVYSLSTVEGSIRHEIAENLRQISSEEKKIQDLNKELESLKKRLKGLEKSISNYSIPHSGYEIQSVLNEFSIKYDYQFSIVSLERIGNFYRLKAIFNTQKEEKFLRFLRTFVDNYPQAVFSVELQKPKDRIVANIDTKVFFWKEK